MTAARAVPAAPATRPGYDPDAVTTARRVLPKLRDERIAWLSTVRADGRPHLVAAWFWFDGEALLVWSRPDAVKVRNLRADPRLMVAIGDAAADFAVGLIEARATLVDQPIPDAFFTKYGRALAAGGLDPRSFRATFTQAIRIEPVRYLGWRGRGDAHDGPPPVAARRAGYSSQLAARLAGLLDRVAARLRPLAPMGSPVPGT